MKYALALLLVVPTGCNMAPEDRAILGRTLGSVADSTLTTVVEQLAESGRLNAETAEQIAGVAGSLSEVGVATAKTIGSVEGDTSWTETIASLLAAAAAAGLGWYTGGRSQYNRALRHKDTEARISRLESSGATPVRTGTI